MNVQTTDLNSPLYFTPEGLIEKLQSNVSATLRVDALSLMIGNPPFSIPSTQQL
jgi:hypothetical protein